MHKMYYVVTTYRGNVQKRSRRVYSTLSKAYDAATKNVHDSKVDHGENSWHVMLKYVVLTSNVSRGDALRVCFETAGQLRSAYISVEDTDGNDAVVDEDDCGGDDSDASIVDT